jgi:hypothetical protein
MKSILFKFPKIALLVFGFVFSSAQQTMKIPKDAVFYMEINGKEVNKKINWEKFNPIIQELTKKESHQVILDEDEVKTTKKTDEKPSWNDYGKTGIKYDATQYHYGTFNDSVKAYTTHFTIDNKEKFQEFVHSRKKEGLEITKKNKYSYVDLDDEMFVAWNDNHAVLSFISYEKPYKYDDLDSTAYAVVDSAASVVDYSEEVVDSAYVEEPFNYKHEIESLKNNIKYLKDNIKDSNAEIAQMQKDIKYLEKNKQYPPEKMAEKNIEDSEYAAEAVPYNESEEGAVEDDEYEIAYQKEMDSINVEKFKITRKLAEDKFDMYFNSNLEIEVPKEMLAFRDSKSDVFIYTDYGKILTEGIYGKMPNIYNFGGILAKAYNSNSSYNLYFDNDKVRLVNNYQHRDADVQKSMSDVYKGKKNKKLAALINDKSIGYYSMNINGSKYFDMMYSFIQDTKDNEYQKEMELVMETMKIILDEEAIIKIAPGNGIFVLNELKSKNVEYTDYEYDDDYNETEVKKTKDIAVPNFVFAFATENEGYWNRVFNLLITNKELAKKFTKVGQFYAFKNEDKNDYIDQMFFTVKDGVVYITTSMENINPVNQTSISKNWAKDSSKYAMSGRLDFQKLISGLEKEFKSPSEMKSLDVFRKNVGDLEFKTEVKGESIETEMNYNIKNSSENSLMYFFDLFDEIYKINEQEIETKVL